MTKRTTIGMAIPAAVVGAIYCLAAPPAQPEQHGKKSPPKADGAAEGDKHGIVIHQEVDFDAPPQRLYEALLDSKQFTAFAGRPSEIKNEAGGAFSLFAGHIVGRNVELVPNQRIVQAWRVVVWPEGVYSIVRFEFKAKGAGTHMVFDHIGFPDGQHDHLADGWDANYWSLLKKYLL